MSRLDYIRQTPGSTSQFKDAKYIGLLFVCSQTMLSSEKHYMQNILTFIYISIVSQFVYLFRICSILNWDNKFSNGRTIVDCHTTSARVSCILTFKWLPNSCIRIKQKVSDLMEPFCSLLSCTRCFLY